MVDVGGVAIGGGAPLALIAGPCVIESGEHAAGVARELRAICARCEVPLVFKASFDKANRSSVAAFRGPGLELGLPTLAAIKRELGVPILTDVHEPGQVAAVAEIADCLQIPAFLCRQTDLLVAAGGSGRAVNVKKGQFLAPGDMRFAVEKVGAPARTLVTERGTTFGYGDLVVDFRALAALRATGCPVVFDATHSVQKREQGRTTGAPEHVPALARAAIAVGIDALFLEVHEAPERALSDGTNAVRLDALEPMLRQLVALDRACRTIVGSGS